MKIAGKIVCFNCRGQRKLPNGNQPATRHLEVVRKGKNPKKKGKVIAEAWVCQLCYDEGHNKVPFGGFNGELRAPTLSPDIMKIAQEGMQKLEKMKEEKQGSVPMYPTKK